MSCGPERDLNVGLLAFGFGVCPLPLPSDAFPGCAGLGVLDFAVSKRWRVWFDC